MAGCPNCGWRTQRTKDWVCEWCGYPLLYGNYKQIDKTFKELQEERNPSWKSDQPEPEPEFKLDEEEEPEPEPEPEPKKEPIWKLKKAPRPSYPPKREPEPEYTKEPESEPAPPPRPKYEPAPRPKPAPQTKPEPLLQPRTERVLLPRLESAPQPEPAPAAPPKPETLARPRMEPPPRPTTEPAPRPATPPPLNVERHAPTPEPKEEPITVPSLESIKDGTQLTIDQIDALFRADNIGANEALKDKTIVIKGLVNKVFIRDHLDIRYLILTGAGRVIWSARCGFDKENAGPMSRLSEGQAAALRGKYEGYGKNIIFKECTLVGG